MPESDKPIATETDLLALYMGHRAALVRFATARTGSPEEAEDVVQELYFRLRQHSGDEVRAGVPYLYRMVLNLVVDRSRSRKRSGLRETAYLETHAATFKSETIEDAPDPNEAIDARRRLTRLLDAVGELPPQCRKVFRLHKLEGRSHAEVAAEMGISRSAVEKHMIAALKALSERFR